jgi:hypothetical protein
MVAGWWENLLLANDGESGAQSRFTATLTLPSGANNASLTATPKESDNGCALDVPLVPISGSNVTKGSVKLLSAGKWILQLVIGKEQCDPREIEVVCMGGFIKGGSGRCVCRAGSENKDKDGKCVPVTRERSPCDGIKVSIVGIDGKRQVVSGSGEASVDLTDASSMRVEGADSLASDMSSISMSPTNGTRESSIGDTSTLLQRGQTPIGTYRLLLRGSSNGTGTCLKDFGNVYVRCEAGSSAPSDGTVCLPNVVVNITRGDVRIVTSSGLNVSAGSQVEAGDTLMIVVDAYDSARNRVYMVDDSNRTIRSDVVLILQLFGQLNTPKAPRRVQLLPDINQKSQLMTTVLESWIREQEPVQSAARKAPIHVCACACLRTNPPHKIEPSNPTPGTCNACYLRVRHRPERAWTSLIVLKLFVGNSDTPVYAITVHIVEASKESVIRGAIAGVIATLMLLVGG